MSMPKADDFWMKHALSLAHRAYEAGEIPVGAVLIDAQQQIIGEGWNQIQQDHDPTAHAELRAIRQAARHLQTPRLEETTLYTTLEPCCMCAGALVHARIRRLVFGTRDFKAGAAGSVYQLLKGAPLNHAVWVDEGPLQSSCAALLSHFFKSLRSESFQLR